VNHAQDARDQIINHWLGVFDSSNRHFLRSLTNVLRLEYVQEIFVANLHPVVTPAHAFCSPFCFQTVNVGFID